MTHPAPHESTCRHDDHHGHSHGAGGHNHHGVPDDFGKAFVIAITLNSGFVAAEFIYGIFANSTALMADAGHNLSDVLGLLLAWGAGILAKRVPDGRFTYGMRGSSIIAAMANAVLLLLVSGAIGWASLQRLLAPPAVAGLTVTLVAGAGILVNGISAWFFVKGSKGDLNIRGAYLHMASDAVMSLGVVIAGIVMSLTGWYWLDPALSFILVVIIVIGTWHLLRESVVMALAAIPSNVDVGAVSAYLERKPGVTAIHDLHIWCLSTTETALTVHLVMPGAYPGDAFMDEITHELKSKFSIVHSTVQLEQGTTAHVCALLSPSVESHDAHAH